MMGEELKMQANRDKTYLRLLTAMALVLMPIGCSSNISIHQTSEISPSSAVAPTPTRHVTFKLDFSHVAGFQTKQTAQANFVKLVITDGTTTKYANGADANGYLAASGVTTTVGADVPDGNYWVATAGMYVNKSDGGLLGNQVKTVFHVPATSGNVDINLSTLLSASVIESLRELDPAWVTANNPNLTNYKAFTDSLTGMTVVGGNFSFTRLEPTLIDPRAVAIKIKDGSIVAVTGTEGGIQNPLDYKQTPFNQGFYAMAAGSNGNLDPVVVDEPNSRIIFTDRASQDGQPSTAIQKNYSTIYALNQTATQLTEAWKVNLPDQHTIMSNYTGLGMSSNRLYFGVKNTMVTPNTFYLRAMNSVTGSASWTFNFPGDSSLNEAVRFAPIAWRNRNGSTCGCPGSWGPERVFMAYNSTSTGSRGVYAINDGGSQAWFYAPPNAQRIWSSGALSKDNVATPFAASLYVVAQHDGSGNFSKLISLDTITGAPNWVLDLGSQIENKSGPVLGTDGTIYVLTKDATQGYLEAINPNGTRKWATPYVLTAGPYDGSPVVDRQNGQDVIFVPTIDKKLHAIYENKTAKWAAPVPLPQLPKHSPVIGEEPDGSHVIYLGQGTTNSIMAIRDAGTTHKILWNFLPEAGVSTGFSLRNNKLLVSTFSGGDGQDIRMVAVKVLASGVPASAPWPMAGGSVAHAGRTSL